MIISTMASSDSSPGLPLDFTSSAYVKNSGGCGPPTERDRPCSVAYFRNIPLPLRRRVFRGCLPGSSPLPWPSLSLTNSALSGSRPRANISALQDSLHVTGCCFAPLPQEHICFSTTSHPEALGACYVASWQLPRPDSHRLADDSFAGHTSGCYAAALGMRRSADRSVKRNCLLLYNSISELLAVCNRSRWLFHHLALGLLLEVPSQAHLWAILRLLPALIHRR